MTTVRRGEHKGLGTGDWARGPAAGPPATPSATPEIYIQYTHTYKRVGGDVLYPYFAVIPCIRGHAALRLQPRACEAAAAAAAGSNRDDVGTRVL